jgi:hypothetical protein
MSFNFINTNEIQYQKGFLSFIFDKIYIFLSHKVYGFTFTIHKHFTEKFKSVLLFEFDRSQSTFYQQIGLSWI